jgi:hypothetical protein
MQRKEGKATHHFFPFPLAHDDDGEAARSAAAAWVCSRFKKVLQKSGVRYFTRHAKLTTQLELRKDQVSRRADPSASAIPR